MEFTDTIEGSDYKATLEGKFTFSDNAKFRTIIEKFDNPEIKQIYFIMGKVELVDSAALGMLLLARDEAGKHQKNLLIKDASGQVKKMFELAHFNKLFSLI